jgi:hypothetical protein
MVKKWWDPKYSKDSICAITQTRLRPGKNKDGIPYVIKLKCNHVFYTSALFCWIDKCNTDEIKCPVCRCNL